MENALLSLLALTSLVPCRSRFPRTWDFQTPNLILSDSFRRTCYCMLSDDIKLSIFTENFCDTLKDLPTKSNKKYIAVYETFMKWKNNRFDSLSEDVFLAYFEEISEKYKPSSLYAIYSILKTTVKARDDVDLKHYTELLNFLKTRSKGFESKKANVLSVEHVQKFLDEAPNDRYLVTKVALIFGITGSCRRYELRDINASDVEDHGDMFLVRITKENQTLRTFTIHGQFYKIVKKYEVLRSQNAKHDRFFQNYQKGKCTAQPIGINKFGAMPREIATYLGLPDAESYTGHSFRRTSSIMQFDYKGKNLLYDD